MCHIKDLYVVKEDQEEQGKLEYLHAKKEEQGKQVREWNIFKKG